MADRPGRQCTVSGGSGSTTAHLADMRATAARLGTTAGDAHGLSGSVLAVGASVPARSAVLSPGSAWSIAELVAELSVGFGALGVRMQFVSSTLRWSATAYELTDAAQRELLAAVNVATTPARLAVDTSVAAGYATVRHPPPTPDALLRHDTTAGTFARSWGRDFATGLDRQLQDDPALVDGVVTWTSAVVGSAGPFVAPWFGLKPPPKDYVAQIGWILASGQARGYFDDSTPLTVRQTARGRADARRAELTDVVSVAADVEHRSGKDYSVVRVQRVVGADGRGSWIVNVPGTTHWSASTDHGPSDATANLVAMAGGKSTLYPAIDHAVAAAMRESGVRPGSEPVMLVGHSQGGIAAAQLAADPAFRERYDVREVVTAGAPLGHIEVPGSVRVLSIENTQDPVPRLDARHNPDAVNRIEVSCASPRGERMHTVIDAHDADRYARSARELTAQRPEDQLSQWYRRNSGYLEGRETSYEFHVRRP